MIRRRDTILSKLTKRSHSAERLAEEFGIAPATVRKHIELLRKEGHDIRYNRKDGKYFTQEAVANMKKTENKLKEFLGQWIGQPSPGHDEQAINSIYRILGEGAAEVEEKAAQLILRYIIRNYNQENRLTIESIQESLGLDKELVEKVLRRLVSERIIAKKEFGDATFYNLEAQRPAFIEAVNRGYLTLTTKEIEELLTVRKSTKPPSERGAVNSLAVYPHGTGKVYRWVPYTAPSFLIPEIFNAFTTSFSRECYRAPNGRSFSGNSFWDYMPRIIYYQQGVPSAEGGEKGPRPPTKPIIPTFPESSLVQALIARQQPDPHLYSLLGYADTTTPSQLSRAVGAVETARIRSLLAYHKSFYEKIKAEGVEGLDREIERMIVLREEAERARERRESESWIGKAKPSVWLTSAYLITLGRIFEYAALCAKSRGSDQYLGHLKEYSETFIQEGAVMGCDDVCTVDGSQESFEPLHALDVEMVCGLVQEQKVGLDQQGSGYHGSCFLASA